MCRAREVTLERRRKRARWWRTSLLSCSVGKVRSLPVNSCSAGIRRWKPSRVDLKLADGLTEADVDRWVQAACVLCSNGCACDIAVKDGEMVGVRGRPADVANHGRLGPKGLYGSTAWASSPDRLTRPMVRGGGRLVETDWGHAMGRVVE